MSSFSETEQDTSFLEMYHVPGHVAITKESWERYKRRAVQDEEIRKLAETPQAIFSSKLRKTLREGSKDEGNLFVLIKQGLDSNNNQIVFTAIKAFEHITPYQKLELEQKVYELVLAGLQNTDSKVRRE